MNLIEAAERCRRQAAAARLLAREASSVEAIYLSVADQYELLARTYDDLRIREAAKN